MYYVGKRKVNLDRFGSHFVILGEAHHFTELLKNENKVIVCKGVLHLLPKISMFCALSQNNQQLFEKINYASYKKLFKELKNSIKILVGQAVFKLQIKTVKMLVLDQ